MARYSIDPKAKIEIDYSTYDEPVQQLRPTVYREGDLFCCLTGPDPQTGIYGCGETIVAAIMDWSLALDARFERLHGPDSLK